MSEKKKTHGNCKER